MLVPSYESSCHLIGPSQPIRHLRRQLILQNVKTKGFSAAPPSKRNNSYDTSNWIIVVGVTCLVYLACCNEKCCPSGAARPFRRLLKAAESPERYNERLFSSSSQQEKQQLWY
jgi:hypothetical protein